MLPRAAIPIQEPLRASRRPLAGVLPELPITYIHDAQPWRLRVFYDDTRPFESLRAPTVS